MLGEGIIKGLAETARNFVGSFVSAERLTTVQYPEERIAPIEATRDFPFLVYDVENRDGGDHPSWTARVGQASRHPRPQLMPRGG